MSVIYSGDGITFGDGSITTSGWTGFKNRVINGAMNISQRYGTTNTTVPANSGNYILDRFRSDTYSAGQTITVQQVTDAPAGFTKSLKVTIGTANSSPSSANSDFCGLNHLIEGYNVADLNWGTSAAKTITVSFWVKSSNTGTFGVSYDNYKINADGEGGGQDNVYVSTYTINAANTWEYKTITIPGCQTGIWGKTIDRGLNLRWCLGASSGTTTGSPNTWLAGSANYQRTSACVQLAATSGATWQITGVQCEVGSTASSFEWRPYGTEFQLCQRYCQTYTASQQEWVYIESSVSNQKWWYTPVAIPMRGGAPSVSQLGTWATGGSVGGTSSTYSSMSVQASSASRASWRVALAGGGGTAYTIGHTDTWNGNKVLYESEL